MPVRDTRNEWMQRQKCHARRTEKTSNEERQEYEYVPGQIDYNDITEQVTLFDLL